MLAVPAANQSSQAAVRNHTLPLPTFLGISRHGIDYISATSEPNAKIEGRDAEYSTYLYAERDINLFFAATFYASFFLVCLRVVLDRQFFYLSRRPLTEACGGKLGQIYRAFNPLNGLHNGQNGLQSAHILTIAALTKSHPCPFRHSAVHVSSSENIQRSQARPITYSRTFKP